MVTTKQSQDSKFSSSKPKYHEVTLTNLIDYEINLTVFRLIIWFISTAATKPFHTVWIVGLAY